MLKEIILGFSSNIDYEINLDKSDFENLVNNSEIDLYNLKELVEVNSTSDLLSIILYSMENGKGGEYFVKDIKIINDFLSNFSYKATLGGTAIRCAYALSILNKEFIVHLSTFNYEVKKIMPDHFNYVFSNLNKKLYPHLIIQYPSNYDLQLKKNISTNKPERLIFVNDPINENLRINKDIFKRINKCKIFLYSGLNCVKSCEYLDELFPIIQSNLNKMPQNSFSYYEDACYHSKKIAKKVRNYFFNNVDFCSLNEDEFSEFTNNTNFKIDPYVLLQDLKKFKNLYKSKFVVVHTSRWSLIYGQNSKRFSVCITSAVRLSAARMAYGDNLTKFDFNRFKNEISNQKSLKSEFSEYFKKVNDKMLFFHPSIEVKVKEPTTVGLGDFFVGGFLASLSEINF